MVTGTSGSTPSNFHAPLPVVLTVGSERIRSRLSGAPRSPRQTKAHFGGTGTSAMMAMFHARGKLALDQPIQSEGLLGTGTFEGCLIGETMLGAHKAVRPTVKGKANIIGTARWSIDRDDPVSSGSFAR